MLTVPALFMLTVVTIRFKKAQLPGGKQEYRTFNSIQATENWTEDIGSAEIVNGKAEVSIDLYSQMLSAFTMITRFLSLQFPKKWSTWSLPTKARKALE